MTKADEASCGPRILTGEFELSSGRQSDWYVDVKSWLLNQDSESSLVDMMLMSSNYPAAIRSSGRGGGPLIPTVIAGSGYGGALLVSRLLAHTLAKGLVLRDDGRWIGCPIDDSATVLLVEDVLTTGESLERTQLALVELCPSVLIIGAVAVCARPEYLGEVPHIYSATRSGCKRVWWPTSVL